MALQNDPQDYGGNTILMDNYIESAAMLSAS